MTIESFVVEAVKFGQSLIRILSDDKDVFFSTCVLVEFGRLAMQCAD